MKYDRLIVGYHGCDKNTADRILAGEAFLPSDNDFDWLGAGIYFWEYGADRASRFAATKKPRGSVKTPAVVGAMIQLGNCFDLMDTKFTSELAQAYPLFKNTPRVTPLPTNSAKLKRLDCAVLNFYLKALEEAGLPPYDTVRCAFQEGNPVLPGSGIFEENHIQVVVRNPACILGVFRPIL